MKAFYALVCNLSKAVTVILLAAIPYYVYQGINDAVTILILLMFLSYYISCVADYKRLT